MSALRDRDCSDFNKAVSAELRADLRVALALAHAVPLAHEIVPVMQRVAQAAAAERVLPEQMLVCVKELWAERLASTPSNRLPADGTWLRLVRTMIEAYFLAIDLPKS